MSKDNILTLLIKKEQYHQLQRIEMKFLEFDQHDHDLRVQLAFLFVDN